MQFQRPPAWFVAFIVIAVATLTGWRESRIAARQLHRELLFAELAPVALANCRLERFGDAHDGGYPLCANLLDGVHAGYSYGIANTDEWGCDVSASLGVPVHQYDCFDTRPPACASGRAVFHAECVGPSTESRDGRPFDAIARQLSRNGDGDHHVVMKIDIEGSEWDSLAAAPDSALERIDQLVIEFHYTDDPKYLAVLRRLHQFFELAHVHFNNFTCWPSLHPFPSWAYETLWVNKSIAVRDASGVPPGETRVDAPNDPASADCQPRMGRR